MKNKATPKNLKEAVKNALSEACESANWQEGTIVAENIIGDYLSQKFTAATFDSSRKPFGPDELIDLFEKIVGEGFLKRRRGAA